MRTDIRDYLRANMFDGDDAGELTMKVARMLDDVSELMEQYIMKQAKAPAPQMPLVGLPNGTALNMSKVLFIARKDIGKYVAFFESSPQGAVLEVRDMEALVAYGVLQPLTMPDNPAQPGKVVQLVKAD